MNYHELCESAVKLGCEALENEPLAEYTSFKIGGPADLLINVTGINALKSLIKDINRHEIPFFVMGNGSNLLVSDSGYRGIVLRLTGDFKKVKISETQKNVLECGAGAPLAKACVYALKNSLSGLEFAWGIPGTCGGAIFMNAGAYGGEMSMVLQESLHVTPDGNIETLGKNQMKLSYRKSAYSDNKCIVSSMKMLLLPGDHDKIKKDMYNYMSRRKNKQPLDYPSAGSVFKRPEGYFAGTLIEECGLKGKSVGGAAVSTKHAGFIVNTGNATCSDVLNLIDIIKKRVFSEKGVVLECEVRPLPGT